MNGIFVIRVLVVRNTEHIIRRVLSPTTPWAGVFMIFIRTMARNMTIWLGGVVRAQHPTRYGDYSYICVPRSTHKTGGLR